MNYADYLDNFDFMKWCENANHQRFDFTKKHRIYTMFAVDNLLPKVIARKMQLTRQQIYLQIRSYKSLVDRYNSHLNNEDYNPRNAGNRTAAWRELTQVNINNLPDKFCEVKGGEYYYTGVKCVNGHLAVRRKGSGCVLCCEAKSRANYKTVPENMKVYQKKEKPTKTITVFGIKIKVKEKI
jgi:hypothetical protein